MGPLTKLQGTSSSTVAIQTSITQAQSHNGYCTPRPILLEDHISNSFLAERRHRLEIEACSQHNFPFCKLMSL